MTIHRDPGPAGPIRVPSRNALFLVTWLVACALGVSGALEGARAFEPALPTAAAASPTSDVVSEEPGEEPGADVVPEAGQPGGDLSPAVDVSDDEQRRLDAWQEYVASLASGDLPRSEKSSGARAGGSSGRGDRGPRKANQGLVRPPAEPVRPADPVDPVAPVEPDPASPLDALLGPVPALLGGVLGLLGGAPPRS